MKLLENLINDEKNIDKNLYPTGPYWHDRAKRCISAIKKNELLYENRKNYFFIG